MQTGNKYDPIWLLKNNYDLQHIEHTVSELAESLCKTKCKVFKFCILNYDQLEFYLPVLQPFNWSVERDDFGYMITVYL